MKGFDNYMKRRHPNVLLQVRHVVMKDEIDRMKNVDIERMIRYELCKELADALFDKDAVIESELRDTKEYSLTVVTFKRGQLTQVIKEIIQTLSMNEIEEIRNPK